MFVTEAVTDSKLKRSSVTAVGRHSNRRWEARGPDSEIQALGTATVARTEGPAAASGTGKAESAGRGRQSELEGRVTTLEAGMLSGVPEDADRTRVDSEAPSERAA